MLIFVSSGGILRFRNGIFPQITVFHLASIGESNSHLGKSNEKRLGWVETVEHLFVSCTLSKQV